MVRAENGLARSSSGLLAQWDALRSTIGALPAERRRWLGAGLLLIVAVVAGMSWYTTRPDWRVLFSGLDAKDVQSVSQELAAAGIGFELTSDQSGIQVSAESLDKARIAVAAKGMPQTGRMGFELFDKPNWVGSEFDEHVNYQRALEGELEHTIETLGDVRSARVHLVLPQQSLFAEEDKAAKASVVMKLKRPSMSPDQADSIRNLVAGAVENLTPGQVTLVDADGRANLAATGSGAAAALSAEHELETRLIAMLEPLAGAGNVRAIVNLSYTSGREEHMDEVYDPTKAAALTVDKKEQTSSSGAARASGVPGTASNAPAAAPAGAVQGSAQAAAPGTPPLLAQKSDLPVYPTAGGNGQSVKQETGTYAVTKHTSRSEEGPGRIRRVTAAIVVNDRSIVEGNGAAAHPVWHPRTAEELHRLEVLAQAAIGFDSSRGDQVVLENVSFNSNGPEMKPTGLAKVTDEAKSILQVQPGLLKTVMLGLLGLAVVMMVLRPVAGQVIKALKEVGMSGIDSQIKGQLAGVDSLLHPPALAASNGAAAAGPSELAMHSDPKLVERDKERQATVRRLASRVSSSGAVLDQLSAQIRREPARSTRLLETWIAMGSGENQ